MGSFCYLMRVVGAAETCVLSAEKITELAGFVG